jgi:hypothetical protein
VESLFIASLHISDFVQTQNKAKILTSSFSRQCRSERKCTSSGWMMLGLSGIRTDETVDRWASGRDDTSSGRLTGTLNSSDLWAELKLLKHFWIVKSLLKSIFTNQWFCPNTELGQSQTNKLPLWPFWDKNHLTGLEIHSQSKNKNYSPFLSQRDKG